MKHGGEQSPCDQKGLMSYGKERPAHSWSECSNRDFEEWYRKYGHTCLIKEQGSQVNCGLFKASSCWECTKDAAAGYLASIVCQGECQ